MSFQLPPCRIAAAGMAEIDRMSGKDFETKMALIFEARGYRVEQTPYVGDWGADLIVSRGGERTAAQIKRWNRPRIHPTPRPRSTWRGERESRRQT